MANMFNEDGTYNKTEWKPGDKISAGKLNKIESSLEAINNNDISRHVEADTRLDILEEQMANTPDNEQMDALEDLVKDNKDAADLAVYAINYKLETEVDAVNDKIVEIHNDIYAMNDKIVEIHNDIYAMNDKMSRITYVMQPFNQLENDNTDALLEELSYIKSNGGISTVYLPKGIIKVNTTIDFENVNPNGGRIEFVGDNTTIQLVNNSYCFTNNKPIARCYSNVTLNNINFDGNIYNNSILVDEKKYYSYQNGVDGDHSTVGSIGVGLLGSNITVKGCFFKNISWSAVDVVEGDNIEIFDNRFENVRQDCIPIHDATNVKVYDNVILNNANHGIHAYSNCSNVKIFNNIILLDKTTAVEWSADFVNKHNYVALKIDHESYPQSKVSNVEVFNNMVNGDYLNALEITGYTHDFSVHDNIFTKCQNGVKYATPTLGRSILNNNTIESIQDCIIFNFFDFIEEPTYEVVRRGELEIMNNRFHSDTASCIGFNIYYNVTFDSFNIIIKNNNYKYATYSVNYLSLPNYIMVKDYSNYPKNLHDVYIGDVGGAKSLFISKTDEEPKNLLYNTDFSIKNETKPLLFNNRASVTFSTNVEIIGGVRYSVLTLNSTTSPTSYNALAYNSTDISNFKNSLYTLNFNMKSESTHSINVKLKVITEDSSVVCDKVISTFTTNQEDTKYRYFFKLDDYESIGKMNSTKFELYFQIDNTSNYKHITNLKLYNISICEGVFKGYEVKNNYVSRAYLEYLMNN